ncbi:MAG: glycine zipper family protein [Acetobacteraceae bacterium]
MRKSFQLSVVTFSAALLVQGCAMTPTGPTVPILPAPGKPFAAFQEDQAICTQYASSMVQGQAEQANTRAVGGAVLGTVLGAGLGAAVGGGRGAGIGAASGAVVGTGIGAGSSANAQGGIQEQYNNAYVQCMVSKGNRLPAPPPVVVQPAPYIVQPAPYVVRPAPYYGY